MAQRRCTAVIALLFNSAMIRPKSAVRRRVVAVFVNCCTSVVVLRLRFAVLVALPIVAPYRSVCETE